MDRFIACNRLAPTAAALFSALRRAMPSGPIDTSGILSAS